MLLLLFENIYLIIIIKNLVVTCTLELKFLEMRVNA